MSLKDRGGGGLAGNPYKCELSSCWEEISYQEVREEIIERKQTGLGARPARPSLGRKLEIPITIRETGGAGAGGRNKTDSEESLHLHLNTKHSPRSQAKTEQAGADNEIIKPFTRKLTYTVPIEGVRSLKNSTSESSQQKVFPPKSPKKIQFEDDDKRSKYIFSSHKIIKDQSKPTPPDVDDDDEDQQRAKKNVQEKCGWKPSVGPRLPLNGCGETERSIKNLSELTEVGETQSGTVSKLLSSFSSILTLSTFSS